MRPTFSHLALLLTHFLLASSLPLPLPLPPTLHPSYPKVLVNKIFTRTAQASSGTNEPPQLNPVDDAHPLLKRMTPFAGWNADFFELVWGIGREELAVDCFVSEFVEGSPVIGNEDGDDADGWMKEWYCDVTMEWCTRGVLRWQLDFEEKWLWKEALKRRQSFRFTSVN